MYAFKCGDDSKHKLEGFSKSRSEVIKFDEFERCLHRGKNIKTNVIIS